MPLQWSEAREPNDGCRYNHVVAESPLGVITIEWKEWKEVKSPTAFMPWGEFIVSDELDDAKAMVQAAWDAMALRVTALATQAL